MAIRKNTHPATATPFVLEGLSAAQHRAVERLLVESTGPFRRSDLTARLLRLLPRVALRSREKADKLAASALWQLAGAGRIRRHGHQHWVVCTASRTLRDGSVVPETSAPVTLSLTTRCPRKWLAVDLETGEVWAGDERGEWRRAALGTLKTVSCAE